MTSIYSILSDTAGILVGRPAPVVLGQLVLEGHEVPSSITIGGRQAIAVHKMPGGRKVLDAMGADDGMIGWQGIFVGPQAAQRARIIDIMRRGGLMQTLSFGDYTFNVVIVRYEYDYRDGGAVIPYRLQAEIMFDARDGGSAIADPEAQMQLDLAAGQIVLRSGFEAASTYAALAGKEDRAQLVASGAVIGTLLPELDAAALALNSPGSVDARSASTSMAVVQSDLQAALLELRRQEAAAATTGGWCADASTLAASSGRAALAAAFVRAGSSFNRAAASLASVSGSSSPPRVYA